MKLLAIETSGPSPLSSEENESPPPSEKVAQHETQPPSTFNKAWDNARGGFEIVC